ncbi:hypothetical protein B0H11DRAFT_2217030 [Mycena galericulata]|nr:hypothetical protein B0H11DRAFT_2217030 [Mycena galericulata]
MVLLGSLAFFRVGQQTNDIHLSDLFNNLWPKYRQKTYCIAPGVVLMTLEQLPQAAAQPPIHGPQPWVPVALPFAMANPIQYRWQGWAYNGGPPFILPFVAMFNPVAGPPILLGHVVQWMDWIEATPVITPSLWYIRHYERTHPLFPRLPYPAGGNAQRPYPRVKYVPQMQNAREGF